MKVDEIVVEGRRYVPADSVKPEIVGSVKIAILQRGWVMIGRFERNGSDCKLHNASVIRVWGTTRGLGELANGPTQNTKLDKCFGLVQFDYLTVVALIDVQEDKWVNAL